MAGPKNEIDKNIADIVIHSFLALILSFAVYLISGNLIYGFIIILGGIFIDLDHLIDYYLFFKHRFNLRDFFSTAYLDSGRVYLFLHAWEINLLIFLLGLAIKSKGLQIFSLGLSLHLAVDNIQRRNPLIYLLTYRIIKKFDRTVLLPEYGRC